jgi:Transposase IS116/IS110/IS902 family
MRKIRRGAAFTVPISACCGNHNVVELDGHVSCGNEESAGKERKRRITPGNRWLKRGLIQAAWAAPPKTGHNEILEPCLI